MALMRKVTKVEGVKPIPPDIYPATLVSIAGEEGQYGPYFKLEFEVSKGTYEGERRSILASDKLARGPKGDSKLLGILEVLSGKKLDFEQEVDIEGFCGKSCRILVDEAKEADGITVQNISKVMLPEAT